MPEPSPAPVDRCARCWCGGCNGLLSEHTADGCRCEECAACPEYACTGFMVSGRITLLFQQLGPLLSSHLNEKAARRCLAVAHAAHHALLDYDHPEDADHA